MKRNNNTIITTICILCTLPVWANSQSNLSFQLINRVTKKGIPFATIKFLGKEKYIAADNDGHVEISNINCDSLNISSIGYYDTTISIASFKNENLIFLSEKYYLSDEVIVGNFKQYDLGIKKLKTAFSYSATLRKQLLFATKVNIPQNLAKFRLDAVKIGIRRTKHKSINPVRLHLYRVDSEGLPSEQEYLKHDIVIPDGTVDRNYLEFDLSSQNIILNRNLDSTLYVGIEFISSSPNKVYDSPEIIITTESSEQSTVFKNLIISSFIGKWVYMSTEEFKLTKSTKKVHAHNMLATLVVSVIFEK